LIASSWKSDVAAIQAKIGKKTLLNATLVNSQPSATQTLNAAYLLTHNIPRYIVTAVFAGF